MTISNKNDLKEIKEIEKELNKYKAHYKMYIRLSVVKLVKEGMSRVKPLMLLMSIEKVLKIGLNYMIKRDWEV